FPRDPRFAECANPILDLYAHGWNGRALGSRDYVISADEKTSIQARQRRHAPVPVSPRRPMRVEHEYRRRGAWAYLAAWDVRRATRAGSTSSNFTSRSGNGRSRHRMISRAWARWSTI